MRTEASRVAQLVADGVVASYIHEISDNHRSSGQDPSARASRERPTPLRPWASRLEPELELERQAA
jgi:hypothetical protein